MDKHKPERPYNVLFLCTGNSARSIMGEAILSRFGAGQFKSFSAGVANLLKTLNYMPELYCSKSWEEFSGPDARCGPASR